MTSISNAPERKLTTIVATDIVGYSRLMGDDEAGTLAAIKRQRSELIEPKAAQYHGRIVKLMGDGSLMEFGSVVDAVRFAVEIQCALEQLNGEIPEDRRILTRIGINSGDIIIDGDDIYGDGVNIASRLEQLAEPGGICVSRNVYDEVRNKLDIDLDHLGEKEVKNIAEPVSVYSVNLNERARVLVTPVVVQEPKIRSRPFLPFAAAFAFVIILGGAYAWMANPGFIRGTDLADEQARSLPDKPSIAVLPLDNMSEDAGQTYFADGMSEDIITDLSKISGLMVISRNSSFKMRGKVLSAKDVARELGVRYVLEGSVRRSGDQLRINVQLIDGTNDAHVWAERYDEEVGEVFGIQDRITDQIVSALKVKLTPAEKSLVGQHETSSLEAYDAFLRGWGYFRSDTPDDLAKAVPYFKEAVKLDPGYSRAYAALAALHWRARTRGETSGSPLWYGALGLTQMDSLAETKRYLELAMVSPTPLAYQVSSGIISRQGQSEKAVAEANRAIELDPNDPAGFEALASALVYAGKNQEGIEAIRTAITLDPQNEVNYLFLLGLAQFGLERYEDAAATLKKATLLNPEDDLSLLALAASFGHLDRIEEAKSTIDLSNRLRAALKDEVRKTDLVEGIDGYIIDDVNLQELDRWYFEHPADRERLRDGLRKAGVPETGNLEVQSPVEISGATTVDAAEAKELFDRGARFVDVRGNTFTLGHIPGAVHLDIKGKFTEAALSEAVAKDEEIVIYCLGAACLRSSQACTKAVTWGYEKVHYFRDGFPAWKAAGYPIGLPSQ